MRRFDVASIGRVAVDFYANEIGVPLSEAKTFSMYVGGSSGNVAIGAARLGLKTAMISRVGGEELGEFVLKTLAAEGVDTRGVKRDPERLTGLVVLGVQPPDRFPLIFFRENCADINLSPADIEPTLVARAKSLFVTGTALSREPSRAAVQRAAAIAREADTKIVLDLDWRPGLWPEGAEGFAREIAAFAPSCALIVGTEEELVAAAGLGVGAGPEVGTVSAGDAAVAAGEAVARLRAKTKADIVVKRGVRGAEVFDPDGARTSAEAYPVTVLNVLGAGDGFAAGLLLGWLAGWPWKRTLAYANAVGAIVVTRHGCSVAIPTRAEVEAFLATRGATVT